MLFELGLLVIANTLTLVVTLIAVFSSDVPLRLRISFIVTIVSLLLWQNCVYVSNNIQQDLLFWNNFVFVWPTAAVLSFYIFTRQLNAHKKWHGSKLFTILDTMLAIGIAVGVNLQAYSVTFGQIFVLNPQSGSLERGEGYVAYIVGLSVSLLSVLCYLILSAIKTRKLPRQKRAMLIVLYTVILAIAYGVMANVVLPLATQSQSYAILGMFTVIIFATGFSASIIIGRLLDVGLYAVRTVAYLFSIVTLLAVYGFLAFVASRIILDYASVTTQMFVNVVLALILAIIFQPVKKFFDKITNKLFYRDDYGVDVFIARLNEVLAATSDLRELLRRSAVIMGAALKSADASFVVYTGPESIVHIGDGNFRKLSLKDVQWLDTYTASFSSDPIVISLLEETDEPLRRMMVSHRLAVILPLVRQGQRMGYLLLGQHKRSNYTGRDIRVLRTIASELVIAIQNALSVEEVKQLNTNLEHRIDAATKELRRSNAQLQRLDESKDEFISMASHQLRTPLTSIKGYISMLIEGDIGKISPEQEKVLNEAFLSSERMVRLISDFLNVSRLQNGKFTIEKHPVDLAILVQREIDSLMPNAAARGMKFAYKMPKNIPMLELDENKLQQVVMNFSDNALYYSKDDGVITIQLKKVNGWIELLIKDNGIGVPKEEQVHLFNKFFRATNARRARPDGTGVGLFLAKKVIDAHDGELIFESTEGKGSTFGFRLPIPKTSKQK